MSLEHIFHGGGSEHVMSKDFEAREFSDVYYNARLFFLNLVLFKILLLSRRITEKYSLVTANAISLQ